ncbi:DUF3606 domain-containing protein [Bradyrhizobium sp. 143]|nr:MULTISPECIES: DUF3606 domain-containing protein [unclassified Bradyrhizobium]MCK1710649.1 DUF3606 domain-containing protein [Bradyrhizobium sp. 143]MCK1726636.1 DUF3606 domain-containing protein [Bradyrhizobium sp. 142]
MDNLNKKGQADRSKINLSEDYEAKHRTKTQLQKAIDKLGNSAVSVRKELKG